VKAGGPAAGAQQGFYARFYELLRYRLDRRQFGAGHREGRAVASDPYTASSNDGPRIREHTRKMLGRLNERQASTRQQKSGSVRVIKADREDDDSGGVGDV
jgi:hypothetical protein